jgi:hypothetical protein
MTTAGNALMTPRRRFGVWSSGVRVTIVNRLDDISPLA